MLYLSQKDMEDLGTAIIFDYERQLGKVIEPPMDIEDFAQSYLGLSIRSEKLSENGKLLGFTTSDGVFIELSLSKERKLLSVAPDSIVLDSRLQSESNRQRRRFTIAHECAHQILGRMEENENDTKIKNRMSVEQKERYRLKTDYDWGEWQANSLGAVLLMQQDDVWFYLMEYDFLQKCKAPKSSLSIYSIVDYLAMKFDVSKQAMRIRLQQLGYFESRMSSQGGVVI